MHLLDLTLSAVNLEEMRRFYVSVLGLREVAAPSAGLSVLVGFTRLTFLPAAPGWTGRYHFAFDVPSDQFEASLAWLHQRQGALADTDGATRFHGDTWKSESVYFTDPQGNILELIARHTKPAPQEAGRAGFGAHALLGVTEFGICVESVPDAAAALITRMPGLEHYAGPGSDEFAPLGDHDGLLIIVRRGRIWFPNTGVPAQPLPFDLLVEVKNGQSLERRYRITAPPYPFDITPT